MFYPFRGILGRAPRFPPVCNPSPFETRQCVPAWTENTEKKMHVTLQSYF